MSGYSVSLGDGHLDDGTLVQLLDGEENGSVREHVSACRACDDRLGALEKASKVLRSSLPAVPMPHLALRPARRRPWLLSLPAAAAATFVVLATAAAATPPIRQWLLRQVFDAPRPIVSSPSTPPPKATRPLAGAVASFPPGDTLLLVVIDHNQSSGVLELSAVSGDRISAQSLGGTNEELIVLPGQLRIANRAASAADYRVTVPPSVRMVRIVIGGGEAAVIRVDTLLHRRIELRRIRR